MPLAVEGLNVINLCVSNRAAILKQLWDVARRKECLWIRWVHSYYIKNNDVNRVLLPKNASWVVRKVIASRKEILQGQQQVNTLIVYVAYQKNRVYSIQKMYLALLPLYPRVE